MPGIGPLLRRVANGGWCDRPMDNPTSDAPPTTTEAAPDRTTTSIHPVVVAGGNAGLLRPGNPDVLVHGIRGHRDRRDYGRLRIDRFSLHRVGVVAGPDPSRRSGGGRRTLNQYLEQCG